MKTLSVIVPVYNELEGILHFFDRLTTVFSQLPDVQSEVIFVDDGSTDGTYNCLKELAQQNSWVRLVRFSKNFGSYNALTAGLEYTDSSMVVFISCDLQDPPELIRELIKKHALGYDVVWASRTNRKNDPFLRRITAELFYSVFRKVAFPHYPPKGYDFCLLDKRVVDTLKQWKERNTSIFAIIVWAGFESISVPYSRGNRLVGKSHWNLAKLIRLANDSLFSFSMLPLRFSFGCAIFAVAGLLSYFGFLLYARINGLHDFPQGWASLMSVILVTSSLQLIILAVLGEYVWRALDQSRQRPRFIISKEHGFTSSPMKQLPFHDHSRHWQGSHESALPFTNIP